MVTQSPYGLAAVNKKIKIKNKPACIVQQQFCDCNAIEAAFLLPFQFCRLDAFGPALARWPTCLIKNIVDVRLKRRARQAA